MNESEERQRVINVAKSWVRTPFHDNAMVKHVGCDCLTFLVGTFEEAGLVKNPDVPPYSPQFMLHSAEEKYLEGLLRYGAEVETPQPGDIAIWKFGRCFSHAALVIDWPHIIHAKVGGVVQTDDISREAGFLKMKDGSDRPVKFISYWGA